MTNRSLILTLITALVLASAWMRGTDPIADEGGGVVTDVQVTAQQELAEIKRLRQKLGGSVLKGSILDAPSTTTDFDSHVSAKLSKVAGDTLPRGAEVNLPSAKPMVNKSVVVSLRKHSAQLDAIANHIESLREYESADSLRDSANELRLIARQLDVGTKPKDSAQVDSLDSAKQ